MAKNLIKEFYACPNCGMAIAGVKRKYFVCPECGSALCEESKIKDFSNNYCGHCGTKLASAKEKALALAGQINEGT